MFARGSPAAEALGELLFAQVCSGRWYLGHTSTIWDGSLGWAGKAWPLQDQGPVALSELGGARSTLAS
jgi:hypothetical protein